MAETTTTGSGLEEINEDDKYEIKYYAPHGLRDVPAFVNLIKECKYIMFYHELETYAFMLGDEIIGCVQHRLADTKVTLNNGESFECVPHAIFGYIISPHYDRNFLTKKLAHHVISNMKERYCVATAIPGGIFDKIYKSIGFVEDETDVGDSLTYTLYYDRENDK